MLMIASDASRQVNLKELEEFEEVGKGTRGSEVLKLKKVERDQR